MRLNLASKLFIFALLLGFLTATPAKGIEVYGRIRGVVTDPSGAVIAGATVTVTNVATGVSTTVPSGADGYYEAPQLVAPGTYQVVVAATGFKEFQASGIPLHVGQIYVLNVQLEVGALTQRVTVEAAPVQVEKTSMQLGATLTGTQIVDLPLNGRNWVQLQQTLPGVVAAADARGNYATNGSQPDQNSYLVNGIDSNDLPLNTPLVIPSPDAIAEVQMVTNTINPEYGRNSGAIMNAVTKSGTNQFHGSGFDFYRDTGLDARNFFQPTSVIFHQHQFGGTIGGPIWRHHTFFFFSYQGTRNRSPQAGGTTTVLTQDQLGGTWGAGGVGGDCAIDQTINPATGEPNETVANCPHSPSAMVGDANSPCAVGSPMCPGGTPYGNVYDVNTGALVATGLFSTGTIPTANFNALSTSLLSKFVPPPNSGTEYDFNPVITGVTDQYMTRIDENISSKDALWGSWLWQRNPTTDTLPFTGANLPGFPEVDQRHIQNYSLTWNHTFGASTLNEARIGYTRFNFGAVLPVDVVDPKSVGFTGITVQDPTKSSWPVIAVTGYFTLGFSTNGPQPRLDQTYQVDDNFTKISGRHTFKMGFDTRRMQVYNPFANSLSGSYIYGGTGKYSTGNAGADFELGIPDSYTQGGGDIINARGREYYFYFQDQFKIRKNLTLTYGTGWQVDTPTIDIYHNNHAMTAFRPGQQSTVFSGAPTGYMFQGDAGVNATGTTKYGHFGPRFGFAWSPGSSGKWAIRGGYGIYFNRELEEQTLQFLASPPFSLSSTGAAACAGSPGFANPFADVATGAQCPNPFPVPSSPSSDVDFSPYLPMFLYAVDPNTTVPYSQNFNLTVERQLSENTILTAAYVGALGRKEVILRELNPGLNPSGCAADPDCVANRTFQGLANPENFQYDPYTFLGIGNNQTTGISNYNSLQVVFNHHMSHGLELGSIYSWSHAMDNGSGFENSGFGGGGFGGYGSLRATNPFNQTQYNYGPSEYDATHRFAVSYTYLIPPIHQFDNWAAKRFVEGWRMSGGTIFQSGFPLDVVDSSFRSLSCWAYTWTACWDVPDVGSAPQYADPRSSSFTNTVTRSGLSANNHYLFDPNTFVRAPIGVQGNAGRNPLRGGGINNFDWALFKDTHITESTRLELRFEFYNLFNHTQFNPSGVSTNINSSNFGRILAARDPRLIQLAAKFYF
ncbi:MAG: carboxypeptidase-like regulatory domain-containing protein [Terriglobia bacterium]|jgi:hypothetical protein